MLHGGKGSHDHETGRPAGRVTQVGRMNLKDVSVRDGIVRRLVSSPAKRAKLEMESKGSYRSAHDIRDE